MHRRHDTEQQIYDIANNSPIYYPIANTIRLKRHYCIVS